MEYIIGTRKGLIPGVREGSAIVFKNIPYAKPPVGTLRFRRPVETDPWNGVLDCTEFGHITVQEIPGNDKPWEKLYYKEFYSNPDYTRTMSEDCLNLNIWIPAEPTSDRLPVAFWIHGGGFAGGYSSELEFGGEEYVKNGVILVTIEYRCDVLGFMAHPWLSAEDEHGISGNYGIFDQIAALRWVYENIEAFGGNPDNITVFGQSAGCMSTQVLISSELTGNMIDPKRRVGSCSSEHFPLSASKNAPKRQGYSAFSEHFHPGALVIASTYHAPSNWYYQSPLAFFGFFSGSSAYIPFSNSAVRSVSSNLSNTCISVFEPS